MNRRSALALVAGAAVAPVLARAQSNASPVRHTLPPLPYAVTALEPVIDAETMRLHHGKHHQTYVDNLNKAVAEDPSLASLTLDELVGDGLSQARAVVDNAGGHWNHSFFWRSMAPVGTGGAPSKRLAAAIAKDFGSLDKMKAAFDAAGVARFGSGWAWLRVTETGALAVSSTPDQQNPLMGGVREGGVPMLGNDVWEHAYYLKHQNRRAEYLAGWWKVVNWTEVSRRYETTVRPDEPAKG